MSKTPEGSYSQAFVYQKPDRKKVIPFPRQSPDTQNRTQVISGSKRGLPVGGKISPSPLKNAEDQFSEGRIA